ncbi:hypothetical protein MATL_G00035390 [Megalops atlanticus]|uniref:Uncharacterized protein n=1 Tax=Megalops atlanticus TaxID=7932 RepID=A0A9D3TK94_MEGAT|nr:hypothetical protein MATL_G00035390 [Megalops atlanticus]
MTEEIRSVRATGTPAPPEPSLLTRRPGSDRPWLLGGQPTGPTSPGPSRQGLRAWPGDAGICCREPGSRSAARVATEIKVLRTAAVHAEREEICFPCKCVRKQPAVTLCRLAACIERPRPGRGPHVAAAVRSACRHVAPPPSHCRCLASRNPPHAHYRWSQLVVHFHPYRR